MNRSKILHLLKSEHPVKDVVVRGWVKTRRDSKSIFFLEVNDGSCLENLQVVATGETGNFDIIQKILTGTSVKVTGDLVPSPAKEQRWELLAKRVEILGLTDSSYPLQKKRHSDEFLRTIAHLRPRTNKYGAMFRIRAEASFAVHLFFKERGFYHIHTPILTTLDCEGAGELFAVLEASRDNKQRAPLFDKTLYLTVSGQLAAEMFACSLGNVYTFGPTFRAENSNTPRHASEFWMVEPEVAFCDLHQNMDLAEEFVKSLVLFLLENCEPDLSLFSRFIDPELMPRLESICHLDFERIPYKKAVDILKKADISFSYPVKYGLDLQTEHERYLTENFFKKPVFVYDYPREIKPFYMRVNDDGQTVAAMDLLVPKTGELIGGSQREERLEVLEGQMESAGISKELYGWYLDSRRYGTVLHSGFGMGFERFLMLATGVKNIRDVIPFPRTPGTVLF